MTDEQAKAITAQFDKLNTRLNAMDAKVDTMDAKFDTVNARFDEMRGQFGRQFETVHDGLGRLNRRLTNFEGELAAHGRVLEQLDTRTHQLGMLQEERHAELKLASEQFQMLQRATNARMDLQREAFDRRMDPLELASRNHAGDLERHERRFTTLENPPTDDHASEAAAT